MRCSIHHLRASGETVGVGDGCACFPRDGQVSLTCLALAPGGVIGMHPATETQLFLVIAGEGWVAGPDGQRTPVTAGCGVRWEGGEDHTSGTETGLTALAVEGAALDLFEPEPPDA